MVNEKAAFLLKIKILMAIMI